MNHRDYRRFYAMCKALDKTKEEAVCEFTDGRTESCRELSDEEFDQLFAKLVTLQTAVQKIPDDWEPKPGDAMRKKMFSIAREMYFHKSTAELKVIIDDFCIKQKKKPLNRLDLIELGQVLTIFETKVKPDHLKALKR